MDTTKVRLSGCARGLAVLAMVLLGAVGGAAEDPAGAVVPEARSPQPYIFWAYGLTCALLFIFSLWTVAQSRRNADRIERLRERFDAATGAKKDVR